MKTYASVPQRTDARRDRQQSIATGKPVWIARKMQSVSNSLPAVAQTDGYEEWMRITIAMLYPARLSGREIFARTIG
jgi:hypothetical protein